MKRRILSLITTLFLTLGVALSGCSNTTTSSSSSSNATTTTTTSNHEHTYSSSYEYDDTYHWHPSTCGHDVRSGEEKHTFTSTITDPTYEQGGYTTYTCPTCGYSYIDNETNALPITITWKNYDGSILEVDKNVPYGNIPSYDGDTPIKESDDRYNYIFAGWTPEVEPVSKDATYTAVFTSEEIKYTIDFDLNDGTSSSYKGPIEVTTFSKDIFFFDCVKEDWQFRGWEYNGEKIFDEEGNQLKNVTLVDDMIFKAIYSQTVKLTITTNMPEAGTITGEGEYPYNTYVDISVTPNQGYNFVGWYYQSKLLSNEKNYTYMMWDTDVALEARFKKDDFYLNIYTNNRNYGLVLLKDENNFDFKSQYQDYIEYDSEVTIAAYSKTDVRFLGWYDENNNLVTTNDVYAFNMPAHNCTLQAKWNYFTIDYDLNGGTNNKNNVYHFNLEDTTIYLFAPTKVGYSFEGWKYNGKFVDKIDTSIADNITLEAIWSPYRYEIREDDNEKYAVIIGYDDSITDVIIPENVILNGEEIPVKEISQTAFKDNQYVESITVSNKVTIIDEYAFDNCSSLESIYLPISVTTIGFYAFAGCYNLTIYCEADSKQEGWSNDWNKGNRPVIWNSYKGFFGNINGFEYIAYHDNEGIPYIEITEYNGSYTDIFIPEYIELNGEPLVVKVIADNVFKSKTITSVTIPDSVTSIGDYAFYKCSNLTTVIISENSQLTSIGYYAFSYCSSLTSIYIPDSVTSIGTDAFYNCSNLTIYCEAYSQPSEWKRNWNNGYRPVVWSSNGQYGEYNGFPYGVSIDSEGYLYITIAGYTGSPANVVIPSSMNINGEDIPVKAIGDNAFNSKTTTSVSIPDSLTSIGSYAFYNCSSLTSIYIPDSVTSIGDYAFSGCYDLTTVTISENSQLTSIGSYAFYNCSSLSSIYIPDNVTFIRDYTFYKCSNLTTVTISENSQLIGDHAFYNCSSLSSIYIPDNVTFIGDYAFYNCSSLTSIYIPDGVTFIGDYAFYNCYNLTTVIISENSQLSSIGDYAFYNCSSLTSIYIPDNVTFIRDYTFYKCSNLTTVTISENSQLLQSISLMVLLQ